MKSFLLCLSAAFAASALRGVAPGEVVMVGVAARGNAVIGTVSAATVSTTSGVGGAGESVANAVALVGAPQSPDVVIQSGSALPVIAVELQEPTLLVHATSLPHGNTSQPSIAPVPARRVEWVDPAIPEGALWPDPSGTINVSRPMDGKPAASSIRNPWDVRVTLKTSISEYKMAYKGGLFGGSAPVVFINGLAFGQNDKIGMFNLAVIRNAEVVLESNGIYYVIPAGRQITIRIPQR